MIVTYNKVQFDAAVSHVLTHNHHLGVRSRKDGEAFLTRLISSGARSTTSYTSSGGFTIIYGCEDGVTSAEITVDASFSDGKYVNIEV